MHGACAPHISLYAVVIVFFASFFFVSSYSTSFHHRALPFIFIPNSFGNCLLFVFCDTHKCFALRARSSTNSLSARPQSDRLVLVCILLPFDSRPLFPSLALSVTLPRFLSSDFFLIRNRVNRMCVEFGVAKQVRQRSNAMVYHRHSRTI